MKKLSTVHTVIFSSALLSVITSAQAADSLTTGFGSLKGLIDTFTSGVVKSLAGLFMALALIAFFWGIVQYIWAKRSGDGKGVIDGNKFMQSGLIALFVMFSVYGIIKFAQNTLMPGTTFDNITIPEINFGSAKKGTVTPGPLDFTQPTDGTTTECRAAADGSSCRGGTGTCRGGSCVLGGASSGGGTGAGTKSGLGGACLYQADCSGDLRCGDTQVCVEGGGD